MNKKQKQRIFISQRGVITTTRLYADIGDDEARQILIDHAHFGMSYVREKYNISKDTFGHIKYHKGSRLMEGVDVHRPVSEIEKQIKNLKARGYNSMQVSQTIGFPLAKINKVCLARGQGGEFHL